MRRGRSRPAGVGAVLLAVVVAFPGSAVAVHGAAPLIVQLRPGDQVAVRGTDLRCGIPSSPPAMICNLVRPNLKPVARSYAIVVAGDSAALLRWTSPTKTAGVMKLHEPAPGSKFPTLGRPAQVYTISRGRDTFLLVGGSDVMCELVEVSGSAGLICGVTSSATRPAFAVPSVVAGISPSSAILQRVHGKTLTPVMAVKQPATA